MQKAMFPMKNLRVSQGYGLKVDGVPASTYSHTGSYALDLGGLDTGAEYLYAPCDVTVMRHYRGTGYNAVWFQSNEEVLCADGKARQLVFLLIHANDNVISELGITVGKTFSQGQVFYKEGTGGGVGVHAHLEVGLAPFTGTGWYQSDYIGDWNGSKVWIINNKLIPNQIFFLDNSVNVKDGYGYTWKYLSEDYELYTNPTGVRITGAGKNVQYFNIPNVDDIAGNNLPTGAEYIAVGYTSKADANGFTYIKFIYEDGKQYWLANIADRVELFEREVTDNANILNKTFFIQANGTNYNLNIYGDEVVKNTSNVNIYLTENVKAQRWVIKQISNGLKLFTKLDEEYALNIYATDNNCTMYKAEGNDEDSLLEFIKVGNQLYQIKMVNHNKYLYIADSMSSGANVAWTNDSSLATIWRLIPEEEMFVEKSVFEKGIDVSDVQGEIVWSQVAADGIKFAILKAVGQTSQGIYISKNWESYYENCKKNNIKVGAYLYTYAFNKQEADDELEFLFNALKDKQFEYPIFVDVEDPLLYQNCTPEQITETTNYICEKIAEAGYYPGIYASPNFLYNYMIPSEIGPYDFWIADWDGDVSWEGDYTMHQYTSDGVVTGISGRVDMDYAFIDYETKIKEAGLNGWVKKEEEPEIPEPNPSPSGQKKMNIRLKLRYDIEANWIAANPLLYQGEAAVVILPNGEAMIKIGNGVSNFNDLKYLSYDANIADWAKQPEKPKYDISEIEQIDTLILYCGNSK